jgi:hypothetical protein
MPTLAAQTLTTTTFAAPNDLHLRIGFFTVFDIRDHSFNCEYCRLFRVNFICLMSAPQMSAPQVPH